LFEVFPSVLCNTFVFCVFVASMFSVFGVCCFFVFDVICFRLFMFYEVGNSSSEFFRTNVFVYSLFLRCSVCLLQSHVFQFVSCQFDVLNVVFDGFLV
jgi:hypothetical protein